MVHSCCVPGCTNNTINIKQKAKKISFHGFAKSIDLQAKWISVLTKVKSYVRSKRNTKTLRVANVSSSVKICSEHFRVEDFIYQSPFKRSLKACAIPSKFNFKKSNCDLGNKENEDPNQIDSNNNDDQNNNQNQKKSISTCDLEVSENVINSSKNIRNLSCDSSNSKCVPENGSGDCENQSNIICDSHRNTKCDLHNEPDKSADGNEIISKDSTTALCDNNESSVQHQENKQRDTRDNAVGTSQDAVLYRKLYCDMLLEYDKIQSQYQEASKQLKTYEQMNTPPHTTQMFSIENFKNSDDDIVYYTGFPNYKILELSLQLLFGRDKNFSILSMNYSKSNVNYKKKLTPEDQYFLTLIKLRQGYGHKHLSTLFNVSESTVSNIFLTWVNYIYITFGQLDIWPDRQVLIDNSQANTDVYKNVIGCLDATEIYIQTPSSLIKQSQTYSQYKSHNTVKGLIVTDLNGAIIFISALYTGSISDNKLVDECGLLQMLRDKVRAGNLLPGDIFLADKGFRIQDLLDSIGLTLNIPAFRINGVQFSPDDVNHNRVIAHERIHVERAIGRLKSYKILSNTIPIAQLGLLNQIWTVCCFLCNFRLPLRKNAQVSM